MGLFSGVKFARPLVALTNLSAAVWLAVYTYRSAAYLQTELQKDLNFVAQQLWPALLIILACCCAACYLYSTNANAYLKSRLTPDLRKSTTAFIAVGGLVVLSAWAFTFAINPRLMHWPVHLDDAVETVIDRLSPEDQAQMARASDDELVDFHFGLGMAIRNDFGLWAGNDRLLRSACGGEYCHPDDASAVILRAVRDELRNRLASESPERGPDRRDR
jgi:hypothetical protein